LTIGCGEKENLNYSPFTDILLLIVFNWNYFSSVHFLHPPSPDEELIVADQKQKQQLTRNDKVLNAESNDDRNTCN